MKRKDELSFCNVLLCFAVIFIHVNSEAVLNLQKGTVAYAAAYILWQAASFAVYGFVFLSGIRQFLGKGDSFHTLNFYKKRLLTVVVPYLLWVGVYYAYDCLKGYEIFNLRQLWYYIYSGDYAGHFYFVVLIVQFYLLMPLWVRMVQHVSGALIIPFSVILTIVFGYFLPNIISVFNPDYTYIFADRTFTSYICFWIAGAYVGVNYDSAAEIFKRNRKFIAVMFLLVSSFSLSMTYYSSAAEKWYPWIEWVMMLYRMTAVMFMFSVSQGKIKNVCRRNFVKLVDYSSYNIYLCHCLVMKIVNVFFDETGISNIGTRYVVRFAVVYIVSIGMCVTYTAVKRRLKQLIKVPF